MTLNISTREFRTLLEMLEIADWILHATKTEKPTKTGKYRALLQKLFACAKDCGLENLITWDEELKAYFPTREFEEKGPWMGFIEDYDNDVFWEELIERLVLRDLMEQEGEEKLRAMELEERFKKEEAFHRKYAAEFEANGIANLTIGKQGAPVRRSGPPAPPSRQIH